MEEGVSIKVFLFTNWLLYLDKLASVSVSISVEYHYLYLARLF